MPDEREREEANRESESATTAAVESACSSQNERHSEMELSKKVMVAAAGLVRAANALPRRGDDYELCASFSTFNQFIQQQESRVNALISRVLTTSGSRQRIPRFSKDEDSFFGRIVDANDALVERAGIVLDEFERSSRSARVEVPRAVIEAESTRRSAADGVVISRADLTGFKIPLAAFAAAQMQKSSKREGRVLAGIAKPQKTYGFDSSIDNSNGEFTPNVAKKHHSMEGRRHEGLVLREEDSADGPGRQWESDEAGECHPYAYELDHFEVPEPQLKSTEPKMFKSLEQTELTMVETEEDLVALISRLNTVTEFAIDLEAHMIRSFQGFICLMQISTREEDFIIDPFPLWKSMHLLNEPFSDPNILKVFHGGDSDVLWLQRDFNIFVRNLFDTGRAMRRTNFGKFSLAHLVNHYAGVTLKKEYQLADWRIRPLPMDYIEYARGDSHFLLFCYDRLREQLLVEGNEQKNLLRAVYQDGVTLCKRIYEKPQFDPSGYRSLIGTRRSFNNRQLYALSQLWKWRDSVARAEDESYSFVLPNHMMLHIAEALPREMQAIIACCSPVPVLVKQNLLQIHKIMYAARDRPLEAVVTDNSRPGTESGEGEGRSLFESMVDEANRMSQLKAMLTSHLDFSHCRFDENIGSELGRERSEETLATALHIVKKESKSTLVNIMANLEEEEEKLQREEEAVQEILKILEEWATPHERYEIAVAENEKRKEAKRKAEEEQRKASGMVDDEGRKLYSHHDPVLSRKPQLAQEEVNVDDINLGEEGTGNKRKAHDRPQFNEDQIMTKKKLKQMQKRKRAAADISTEVPAKNARKEEDERSAKRKIQEAEEGEIEEEEEAAEVVNYAQYDANSIFDNPKTEHAARAYNPHRESGVRGRGRGQKRGRGGRGSGSHSRARGVAQSFRPRGK